MPSADQRQDGGEPDPSMTGKARVCIAPWCSVVAKGFVPRVYLVDEGGWPLRHVDGPTALPTYEQAVEAARLLRIGTDEPPAA